MTHWEQPNGSPALLKDAPDFFWWTGTRVAAEDTDNNQTRRPSAQKHLHISRPVTTGSHTAWVILNAPVRLNSGLLGSINSFTHQKNWKSNHSFDWDPRPHTFSARFPKYGVLFLTTYHLWFCYFSSILAFGWYFALHVLCIYLSILAVLLWTMSGSVELGWRGGVTIFCFLWNYKIHCKKEVEDLTKVYWSCLCYKRII